MQREKTNMRARILALFASYPEGISYAGIKQAMPNDKSTVVGQMVYLMGKDGTIFRVGPRGQSMHFVSQKMADAWLAGSVDRAVEAKERNLEARREAHRISRGSSFMVREKSAFREPRQPRQPRAERAKKALAPVKMNTKPKVLSIRTKIVWPDSVKVQVIETKLDTRFLFVPPPGWRGEITRDWLDRRLQSA